MDPTTSSLITSIKTAIVPDSITPTLVGNTLERLADAIDRCATADSITTIANDADVVYIHDYDTQTAPEDIPGGDNNSNDHTAGWICYIAQANAFALRRWSAPYDFIGWLYPTGADTYGTYAQLTMANGYCSVCRPHRQRLYMARTTNWGITANTFAPVLLYRRDNDAPLSPVLPPLATTAANGLMSKEDKLKLNRISYQSDQSGNQTTFVYSQGNAIDGFTVLSSGTKIFQNGGKLKFKKVNWGASDPTNGNDYIIPTATTSNDGAMSREDKAKLDGYTTGFSNNQVATLTTNGLMSKEDKALLVGATSGHDYMQAQLEALQSQLNNLLQTLRDNGTI